MKKALSIILLVSIMILSVGCNTKTTDEAVTLKLGLPSGKDVTPMEILDSFKEKNPNITVELDESPWNEFKKKLKMQIAASNPPNTFIMDSGYVAALGAMGASVDLSDRVKKELNEKDYSSALFAGKDPAGRLWGIPHGINSVAIYYNKTLFDQAGLPYPEANWTFDDMFELASKLTRDTNGDGTIDQYGMAYGSSITDGWLPFVAAMGGAPLDETRKKSMFKDEKTIEGLKKYVYPQQSGISPSAEWIAANGNSVSSFYMGKIGLYMAQASVVNILNKNAPQGFNYDVQMMPIGWDGQRHCVYVPNQWTIFSRTTDAEQNAAWKWVKHFISEESQMKVADTLLAGYPIKQSALDYISKKNTVPTNMKAFYEGIDDYGLTIYENKTFEEWRPKVDLITTQMRRGEKAFDAGLEEIEAVVTESLVNE